MASHERRIRYSFARHVIIDAQLPAPAVDTGEKSNRTATTENLHPSVVRPNVLHQPRLVSPNHLLARWTGMHVQLPMDVLNMVVQSLLVRHNALALRIEAGHGTFPVVIVLRLAIICISSGDAPWVVATIRQLMIVL
ncbi:hypothetical protein CVT26_015318 [Gymnopilus dilepis]|uniref:Uncharacterized protein n=1 Tax=Gymnopilus dilepis TaxID=231916 RepID=A0A409W4C5_9AGAR|nr:hypothetical protein CVT26_015318 [Gymnopilus dilepis]